jgi:hypothetical protein
VLSVPFVAVSFSGWLSDWLFIGSKQSCMHARVPAGARHEHRLKTTLLSKASSGSQQQHSQKQQQYIQQQYAHGCSNTTPHAHTAAAAAAAAGGRNSGVAGNTSNAVQRVSQRSIRVK